MRDVTFLIIHLLTTVAKPATSNPSTTSPASSRQARQVLLEFLATPTSHTFSHISQYICPGKFWGFPYSAE
jgi:hypothetical protein